MVNYSLAKMTKTRDIWEHYYCYLIKNAIRITNTQVLPLNALDRDEMVMKRAPRNCSSAVRGMRKDNRALA